MNDDIFQYYRKAGNAPSMQTAGGGFFKTLGRYTLPIFKTVGERVLRVAARTARDVVGQRQNLKDALMGHAFREIGEPNRSLSPSSSYSEINKVRGGGVKKRKPDFNIFTTLKRRRL